MNTNVISKIVLESEIKDLQKYYQIFFVSVILMAVPIARYIGKLIDEIATRRRENFPPNYKIVKVCKN